tara:strand:+ start:9547 stop:9846 length:300 start_codon:yes stop_codon:yes gene_type:complete
MYLVPLVRANRAIAASLIYPSHPIQAVIVSETISIFAPLLDPQFFSKILGLILAYKYNPTFATLMSQQYLKINLTYNQAEICCLLLFNLLLFINHSYLI